jgi:hypothetical protein
MSRAVIQNFGGLRGAVRKGKQLARKKDLRIIHR